MKKLIPLILAASLCVLTTAQAGSGKSTGPKTSPIVIMGDDDTCHGC